MVHTPGVFCPAATIGCLKSCLGHTSGMMQLPSSTIARDRRTALYIENEALFMRMLRVEIEQVREAARQWELLPAIRLNGTSDIPWEMFHPELFDEFSDVQFFDYTKLRVRMKQCIASRSSDRKWPTNYHLTFSADGNDKQSASELLTLGGNVAVVFHPVLPKRWWNTPVMRVLLALVAMSKILDRIPQFVMQEKPFVANPVNPAEDFADRWSEDTRLRDNFWYWYNQARADFASLGSLAGTELASLIRKRFSLGYSSNTRRKRIGVAAPAIPAVHVKTPSVSICTPPSPWGC